ERLTAAQQAREETHSARQHAGALDDREGAADEEDQEDDRAGVEHAARDGDDRRKGSDRVALDRVEGAGDDEPAPGRRIVVAIVLTGRQEMRRERRDEDAADEQGESVGEAESAHAALLERRR